jgi:hypothetical protein
MIKLFEEFTESDCLINRKEIAEWTIDYIKTDYWGYFGSAIESEMGEDIDPSFVELIKYFVDDNITIDVDDGAFVGNGYKDLLESIGNFAKEKAKEVIDATIKKALKEEALKNIDNWVKNKELYKELQVELPEDIKRSGETGLWDLKK